MHMNNELDEVRAALLALNRTAATGPVMLAWEDSDGRTVMSSLPRQLARSLLKSALADIKPDAVTPANPSANRFA